MQIYLAISSLVLVVIIASCNDGLLSIGRIPNRRNIHAANNATDKLIRLWSLRVIYGFLTEWWPFSNRGYNETHFEQTLAWSRTLIWLAYVSHLYSNRS